MPLQLSLAVTEPIAGTGIALAQETVTFTGQVNDGGV
jgi:hypothetical protein